MKKAARDKKALPLGQAALDELIEEITVDAYGEDEQLWAFRQAFEDTVALPAEGCVVGEPVLVIAFDYDGNERRGLTAKCRAADGRKRCDPLGQLQFARDAVPSMALEELRHNHRVVKDRVGSQLVIALERHGETRQIVSGDRIDRIGLAKELTEPFEHGFVFAMRVGLLQRSDLLQILGDGNVERWFLDGFARRFKPGYSEFAAFEFMVLAPLSLKRLSCGYARACSATRSARVPLDVVTAAGQSVPVVVAFGISGDGKHLPLPVRFDAFDDVDPGQSFSPAIRPKRTAGKTAYGWK